MRVVVFSDVHGNLAALEAVLKDAGPADAYWCLGDLVGYGPEPNACVARVKALPNLRCVLGNHDAAVLGKMSINWFNTEAQKLIVWTQGHLTAESVAFLSQLPEQIVMEYVTLVHGSPRAPITEYLLSAELAHRAFQHFETDFCFVGHTHQPVRWQREDGHTEGHPAEPGKTCPLHPRAILNPGSVGQPRDGDPRAAYALYDTETHQWTWRRVAYDVTSVQAQMHALGLSAVNAERLSVGR